jgi:hypothetical protein
MKWGSILIVVAYKSVTLVYNKYFSPLRFVLGLFACCISVSMLMSNTYSMHILHTDQCHLMCHTLKCTWSVVVIQLKNGTGKAFDVTEGFLRHIMEVCSSECCVNMARMGHADSHNTFEGV